MMMKYLFTIGALFLLIAISNGQTVMSIFQKGGLTSQFLVNNVDSIVFLNLATSDGDSLTDIDGNVYHIVTIGTQVWMVENLKTTKYSDGTSIPNVTDDTLWTDLTTGAYCDYKNIQSNSTSYGRLYNWYAVNNTRKIAPTGWHVATNDEWNTLTTYLGGEKAGIKLKEAGTAHWLYPPASTNESGFSARPGGYRVSTFYNIGINGVWWCSTESSSTDAWSRAMHYMSNNVIITEDTKSRGFSVRCLRDY